jgi:hypothetical protein
MGRCRNPGLFEELSISVAAGSPVARWARSNSVPVSTARHWAALPEFKARVERHRRRLTGRELELLARESISRQAAGISAPAGLRAG